MRSLRVLIVLSFAVASLALTTGTAHAALTCAGYGARTSADPNNNPLTGDPNPDMEGTSAGETIMGTPGSDVIIGGGGNDIIYGNGGMDQICGDDDSHVGSGNDTIYGGTENDVLLPGGGNDDVFGGTVTVDENISDQLAYATAPAGTQGMHIDVQTGTAYDNATAGANDSDLFTGIEVISGTPYDDTMIGSDETDDYFAGEFGDDHMEGKGGIDALSLQGALGGVNVFLEGGTASGMGDDTFSSMEYIIGSEYRDFLVGSEANNVIFGGDGDDYIWGRGGNDPIVGQGGNDHLFGGAGEIDWIAHEDRPDLPVTVNFSTGTVTRSDGTDEIFGFELTNGSQQADTFIGNNGTNFFIADAGADVVDGGGGSDLIAYFRAPTAINGDLDDTGINVTGFGNDMVKNMEQMTGTPYNDVIRGTPGNNYLNGLDGHDKIFSEGGADYIIGGKGNDKVDGGGGLTDLLDFSGATTKITADLQTGKATGEGNDTLKALEQLSGSPYGDVLRGNNAANKFLGAFGNDKLFGRGGNDALSGQDGNDQIDGAGGKDVCNTKNESKNCESYTIPKDHPLLEVSRRYKRLEDLDRRYKRRYK